MRFQPVKILILNQAFVAVDEKLLQQNAADYTGLLLL
jgi:hypothetical protein